jgi:hypothetical protein
MNKQEEVREGVEGILGVLYNFHLDGDAYASQILDYLHSQGVVVKVDGELYPNRYMTRDTRYAYEDAQRDMLEVGYVAVEPLIEE